MKINLSLSKKFSLLLSLFVLITVGVLYLLVKSYDEPINFGLQEKKGNKYQRPVEKLFFSLAQHRVLAQRLILGNQDKAALVQLQSAVEQGFTDIKKVDEELNLDLQFTEDGLKARKREHVKIATVYQEWKDLVQKIGSLKENESNDLHAHLITDVRTIIAHLGDTSNLILDPDLDSYYLMDITLLALPQIHERIQNASIEFQAVLNTKQIKPVDRIKASVFVSMMKEADLGRVTGDYQTVLNEDPNFYGKSPTLDTKLTPIHQKFVANYEEFVKSVETIAAGTPVDVAQFNQQADKALASSFEYWDAAADEMDQFLGTRVNSYQNMKVKALLWSVLGMLVALSIAWMFLKYVIKDLDAILGTLNHASNSVAAASNESASLAVQLSEASVEQAAGLQETMASTEEIAAMVRQNSETANKTKEAFEQNHQLTEEGVQTVSEMLTAIREIKDTNNEIVAQMESSTQEFTEIVKIISEIGEKTKVINDIVFQTKLLSFNASVEAARAGEAGKGFAVVAEEVGNLASLSGNSSREISNILESSIKKVQEIVNNTKTRVDSLVEVGRSKIEQGELTAEKCHVSLNNITENARSVTDMISEIAVATKEQSQGIDEINKAIIQIDQVTQQNSSVASQSSNQSENLRGEANVLAQAIVRLNAFVTGKAVQDASAPHSATDKKDSKVISLKKKKAEKAAEKKVDAKVDKKAEVNSEWKSTKKVEKKANFEAPVEQSADPVFAKAAGFDPVTPSFDDPNFSED